MGKPVEQLSKEEKAGAVGTFQQIGRVATFWRRGIGVYIAYKGAQVWMPQQFHGPRLQHHSVYSRPFQWASTCAARKAWIQSKE